MIEFLCSWVKGLGLAIVIISILEMLLPNNKTKKYIRMIMGIYVLFTMISPFISNKEIFDINNINLEEYTVTSSNIDQNSMDERIEELYIQELEKDITKKLEEKGYEVTSCNVKAKLLEQEKSEITKIKVNVKNNLEEKSTTNNTENQNIEDKIVTQIQKVKTIDTSIEQDSTQKDNIEENDTTTVSQSDIQNIKKFLIEEYGVNEKCLEIN